MGFLPAGPPFLPGAEYIDGNWTWEGRTQPWDITPAVPSSIYLVRALPGKRKRQRRQPPTQSRFYENAFGSMRYEGFWHLGYPSAFFASQFSPVLSLFFLMIVLSFLTSQ